MVTFDDIVAFKDIFLMIQSNLLVWERVSLSLVCRGLSKTVDIRRGDFEQVKNKYYTNLQLLDQYNEWRTLLRMKTSGISCWAPERVTRFVRSCNSFKRVLSKSNTDRERGRLLGDPNPNSIRQRGRFTNQRGRLLSIWDSMS